MLLYPTSSQGFCQILVPGDGPRMKSSLSPFKEGAKTPASQIQFSYSAQRHDDQDGDYALGTVFLSPCTPGWNVPGSMQSQTPKAKVEWEISQ